MTETTKTIFGKYEVRKTKKQKTDFINWVKSLAGKTGYDINIEKGLFGARNIIIGDPEKAKVIYTAHYDTCAKSPFPNLITPKNIYLYAFGQIIFTAIAILILSVFTLILYSLKVPFAIQITEILLCALIISMMFGPANKHTANDNTSGVTTIIDTINAMPKDLKTNAAFILFDLEEAGLWGSISYRLKHNKSMKEKLLINFDCVSDGNNILIVVKKGAKQYIQKIKNAFKQTANYKVEVLTKKVFYPSDQMLFPTGVGVAALKCTKRFNILYMNRIHTKKDTAYQERNIHYLVKSAISLTRTI